MVPSTETVPESSLPETLKEERVKTSPSRTPQANTSIFNPTSSTTTPVAYTGLFSNLASASSSASGAPSSTSLFNRQPTTTSASQPTKSLFNFPPAVAEPSQSSKSVAAGFQFNQTLSKAPASNTPSPSPAVSDQLSRTTTSSKTSSLFKTSSGGFGSQPSSTSNTGTSLFPPST